MKLLYPLLTAVAILSGSAAFAQKQYETISKTFRITYIYKDDNNKSRDTALAYFPATRRSGLEPGTSGVVLTTNENEYYYKEIGRGFVVTCDSNGTYVYVISSKEALTDSSYMTKVGDLITLDIKVPKKINKSIFYDLETLGITFYKRDDDRIWNFEDLVERDGKKMFDSLVNECIKECKLAYTKQTTSAVPDSNYRIIQKKGRNKGKTALELFKDPNPRTILPFLTYAKDNKGTYRGQQYYLESALKGWMKINSPYSYSEMLDTLLSFGPQTKKFSDFVSQYKQEILDGEFVDKWSFIAMDKQNEDAEKAADDILKITYAVSKQTDDNYGRGLHFLAQAQIFQYRSKYKESLVACDSSLKYLTAKEHGHFNTELYIKKGYLYQKLNMLKESEAAYDKAAMVAKDTSNYLEGDTKEYILGRIHSRKGDTYNYFDEYAKAVEAYKSSIDYYTEDNTYTSLSKIASVQSSLADVYKRQGAYSDAYDIYSALRDTYMKLTDVKNAANSYDNLGYVEFKQGKYREAMSNHRRAENIYNILKIKSKAAYSLSQIGQAYWNLGNYDSAIICHYQAITNAREGQNPSDEAYSWSKLASLYSIVGDKAKALAAYDSSSYAYEAAQDSVGLVDNLISVGDVFKTDGQYQKAFDYYSKAHTVNLKRGNKSSIIDTYFKLGSASYYFDTALSKKNYFACYTIAKEIDDKSNLLYSSLNLGLLASRTYDYTTSEKFFSEGLALSIAQNSKSDEAYAYEQMGYGKMQKLEFDKAFKSFNKAVTIYDSLGERSKMPNLYINLGNALQSTGDFNKSIEYYERSKSLAYSIKNMADVANVLQYLSFAYMLSGDAKSSLRAADSCLLIYKDLNNNWQIGNAYLTMGNTYNGMNDYQKAVEYYKLSDSLYALEKDEWSRGVAKNNIGNVYYMQADYPKALQYFLDADNQYKVIKTINESILLTRTNIGETYFAMYDFDKAKQYLLDVYKRSKESNAARTLAGTDIILAKIAIEENKLQDAARYLDEGKAIAYKTNEAIKIIETHLAYGRLYAKQNNYEASINNFRTAVEYARKTQSEKYLWEGLYELGISFYNKNNLDSAIIVFKQAVEVIETGASKLFGGAEAKKIYSADIKKVDLYNKLVACLAKLKKADEALFYADKSNSQAIKEKLEQSGIVTADKDKGEALKKGNELLQKQTAIEQAIAREKAKPEKERNTQLIASLEGVKKVAEEDYLNFINQLVQKYPDLNSYFSKTDPSQFRNYIDLIPDSTIVILYVINDKQLFIFTVTNQETGIKVVDLPEDINSEATRFLSILKNPENATGTGAITVRATIKDKNVIKGDFKTDASILYNLLITPIDDQLKDKKTLCIIPNSKLSSIPFASLGYLDQANQFHFLIENYKLFYTNKIEIFSKPYKPQDIEKSFVVFGNPDKSLPGATQEAKNIAEIFPSATVYLEENATEEKAKDAIKNFGFVHFATHGILDGEDFSKSYLLFNADGTNDGKLSIAEVNGLIKKETSLVFLSACDMAVSKETVKGWYISPINAFLNNRVTTGVGPLWQVPDEATQILLTEFYKNIKYLKMTKTDALRHAQSTLSKNPKYSHPYFWAAFVLYGEWR